MKKLLSLLLLLALALSVTSCASDPAGSTTGQVSDGSTTDTGYRVALDLTTEWNAVSSTQLVQGCLIVRTGFASDHSNELASFLSDYSASIAYMQDEANIATAAQLVADAGILPSVAIATQAIPRSNITYMVGDEMRAAALGFYSALSITAPSDDFFYAPTGDAASADSTVIRIGYFAGTTGIGMAKMIGDGKSTYTFTKYDGPTNIIAAIARGDIDIAALPTNAAPNVYKQTNGAVQMLAINTLGVLYVCTNGTTVNALSDLNGKTIYVPEQAPKLVLEYILNANGIQATVSMEYDLDTLPNAIAQGIVQIAVLPEPKVTVAGNLYQAAQAAKN
jgi:hypothetical protein